MSEEIYVSLDGTDEGRIKMSDQEVLVSEESGAIDTCETCGYKYDLRNAWHYVECEQFVALVHCFTNTLADLYTAKNSLNRAIEVLEK